MRQLGKYLIMGELGRGGMGMVYRGRDPYIGRDVAVKVIHEHALDAPTVKQRFLREARSAGRLSHDNIMTVYDIGEENGTPYLVMELLSGTDLRKLMQAEPPLRLDQKLSIAIQTCAGLGYAHTHGVIHRDVKPDNIQVLENGRVKIMDFGIARLESEDHTLTSGHVGTPRYMSPEQIKGDKVDHRTDIFSFGVLLYELLAGKNPFSGDRVTTVIYKILHVDPDPIRLEESPLSGDLQNILSQCLAKEVDSRYPHFEAVAADLEAVLEKQRQLTLERTRPGGPAGVLDSTSGRRPAPPARTRRLASASAALLALVAVAAAAGAYIWFSPGRETETGSDAPLEQTDAITEHPAETSLASGVDPLQPESLTAVLPAPGTELPETEQEADAGPRPAGDDLAELVSLADWQRALMVQQKGEADGAGAARLASKLYTQAQEYEEAGARAMRQKSRNGYAAAQTAFGQARTSYESAAQAVRARSEAEKTRQAMLAARRSVSDRASDAGVSQKLNQANQHATRGDALFRDEDFQGANRSFQAAQRLYADVRNTPAQPAADPPAGVAASRQSADLARTAMLTVKEALGAASQHALARQASDVEVRALQAYEAGSFDEAAASFKEAEVLFRSAVESYAERLQAEKDIRSLASQFESLFERGDVSGLRSLNGFYSSWSEFFAVAHGVTAAATLTNLTLNGDEAAVDVRLQFQYLDNKNRSQSSQFTHGWTLRRIDGRWAVAGVQAR